MKICGTKVYVSFSSPFLLFLFFLHCTKLVLLCVCQEAQKICIRNQKPRFPPYKYEPQVDVGNDTHKLYWNCDLLTENTVYFNWPNIILVDRTIKEVAFIGIATQLTHNLQATITEKQSKYQELAFDNRQQWQLNKITVTPFVLAATPDIHNMLNQSLTAITLPPCLLSQVQKVIILNNCCITRKFLSDEVHYRVKRLTTHSHESLLCSRLYTLISTYPDTTTHTVGTQQHQT
jgi:hypothetical protein